MNRAYGKGHYLVRKIDHFRATELLENCYLLRPCVQPQARGRQRVIYNAYSLMMKRIQIFLYDRQRLDLYPRKPSPLAAEPPYTGLQARQRPKLACRAVGPRTISYDGPGRRQFAQKGDPAPLAQAFDDAGLSRLPKW
jgi:hypothetical protein